MSLEIFLLNKYNNLNMKYSDIVLNVHRFRNPDNPSINKQ